ncbi:MAG TPA: TIGR00296 family protein [Methanoregulaceae archaeon]|nr:TIGR00296 family protein [Methanoregulaceae archaeon]
MDVLTPEEGELAVGIARETIEAAVGCRPACLPSLPAIFQKKRGVFVTITKCGELRGCIGFPYPVIPLKDALSGAAASAALEDPRFPPVRPQELPGLSIDVTILTPPEPLTVPPGERPSKVVPGKHGLIVRSSGRSGLLLPQVATEYNWNAVEFLHHTCMKAGLTGDCWKNPATEVLTFEGQIFSEQGTE